MHGVSQPAAVATAPCHHRPPFSGPNHTRLVLIHYFFQVCSPLTNNTGVAPVKGVPPAKVMSPWRGGTGIAKFAGAIPLMTSQLTAIQGDSCSLIIHVLLSTRV